MWSMVFIARFIVRIGTLSSIHRQKMKQQDTKINVVRKRYKTLSGMRFQCGNIMFFAIDAVCRLVNFDLLPAGS